MNKKLIKKRILQILFFCLAILLPSAGHARDNSLAEGVTADLAGASTPTLSNPDFAYPQTMEKNVAKIYQDALEARQPVTAIRAAMQLNIADNLITTDSVVQSLARYRYLASNFKDPYSALAKLLEARLLLDIYSSTPYVFDNRTLPEDASESNPMLWDGARFKRSIMSLVREVWDQRDILAESPIATIAPLLNNAGDAEKAGMTTLDFVTYRIVELLEGLRNSEVQIDSDAIPFESDTDSALPSPKRERNLTSLEVIDDLINHYSERYPDSEALLRARLTKTGLLKESRKREYAEALLATYGPSDKWRPLVVNEIVNDLYSDAVTPEQAEIKRAELLEETIRNFPDSRYKPCLENKLEIITRPFVSINVPGQAIPGMSVKGTYELRNLKDCYVLLVPVNPPLVNESYEQRQLSPRGEIKVIDRITRDGASPGALMGEMEIPGLSPGYYAIVPSSTPKLTGLFEAFKRFSVPVINVCGFNIFTASGSSATNDNKPNTMRVYVSDATTGAPVRGAKYQCWEIDYRTGNKTKNISGITDENGSFESPFRNFECLVTHNGSRLATRMYNYPNPNRESSGYSASIMTDLALYHPGDEVNIVAILSKYTSNLLSPASDKNIDIELMDVNRENVATIRCITDKYGRATANFKIPEDGLTGDYLILVSMQEKPESSNSYINSTSVVVAEYKAPTFRVLLDSPALSDDMLELTGSVLTYSGMPLNDVDVNINVTYNIPWWRRYYSDNLPSRYTTRVTTDQSGRFSVKLGIGSLLGTPYEAGWFNVTATATSDAGETESASPQSFTISQGFHIEIEDRTIEVNGDTISIPVKVADVMGKPAVKELSYEVTDENGEIVTTGKFHSPALTLVSSMIKSGKYRLRTILADAIKEFAGTDKGEWKADTAECTLIIWRRSDVKPPYPTPLWIPEKKLYASQESDVVNVKAGSGYSDSYLFYQVSDCHSIIKEGWIKASDRNIELPVKAPEDGNRIKICFRGMHDLQENLGTVTVLPAVENRKLRLSVETFRNRIDPTSRERWRFLFSCEGQPIPGAPAMAVLSDAALNSIVPFRWSMNNRNVIRYPDLGNIRNYSLGFDGMGGYTKSIKYIEKCDPFRFPDWNLWKHSLYDRYGNDMVFTAYGAAKRSSLTGSVAIRGGAENMMAMKMASAAEAYDDASEESAMETADIAEMEMSEDGGSMESEIEDIPLRDTQHPLAFFKPLLLTGDDGVVDISFDVPDFNTTWAFQLLAYDDNLRSAYLSDEVVTAKPVMISTNMPRFLLTGDKATVAATMFNNSDTPLTLRGRIEVIDPITGNVISSSDSDSMTAEPSANVTFNVEFMVPNECNALIIRSVARSERGSDGEQDMIQVLPSSQPVLDATTFYLTPADRDIEVKLPRMGTGDMVTLNYCANPAWYVLTSLSGFIKPETESTLANLNALYANCVAGGLISRYPNLHKGIELIFDAEKPDSLMTTSPLEKENRLKISTLQNTPWVNNAESETLRMQGLAVLTDPKAAEEAINGIMERLRRNQTPDGGFKWMPQMKDDDLWITLNVLDCAARIKESGFSPKGVQYETMIVKALRYTDTKIGKGYHETVHKHKARYSLVSEMNYLLTRSILATAPPSGQIEEMRRDMLNRLPKEWKDLSIADKTVAARILKREGNGRLASEIMESVKEFASYKPDKGMWFDKLREDLFSPSPKMVTALAIQALNEVLPKDEAIMKMCQYLVLSRQTEDWNLDMSPATVTMTANAVLASDLGWISPDADTTPVITLNGKALKISETEALTGNICLDLTPEEASEATLSITRTAAVPAWGGILRQYVAPVKEVKSHSVPQLKVTKRLLPIERTMAGEKAGKSSTSFKKGDLIRVTLTLETDRDLDYLLINDRRGAFMQPVDQLTSYTFENGLWLLRETRNTATNFYLTRLPKGEYILTYDVHADRDGEYSTGITTAQSQYYPLITAHSAGALVTVEQR